MTYTTHRNMKTESPNTKMTLQDISRLARVFETKQWPQISEMDENIFDEFCNMLSSMSQEEINLILELTDDFIWINESQYIRHFCRALDQMIAKMGTDKKRTIVFCPLLPEEDFYKSKSSVCLLYQIKAFMSSLQQKYQQINISYVENPKCYDETRFGEHYICLVDDFIGSGQTAESAATYFLAQGIDQKKIIVLSLVAMKAGIECINRSGINAYAGTIVDRGIAYRENAEEKYQIMRAIEDRIGVNERYRFGYEQSEALVKMARTPNNTFPVYWLKNKKHPYCPFPR